LSTLSKNFSVASIGSFLYHSPRFLAAVNARVRRINVRIDGTVTRKKLRCQIDTRSRACRLDLTVSWGRRDDKDLARRGLDHFQGVQDFLKQGNWSRYGEEVKKVEVLLREMPKAP